MTQFSEQSIYERIKDVWKESGALPEFIEAMRLALPDERACENPEVNPARWSILPGLCCQAADGSLGWTEDLSTAWFLFYAAAHVFDSIEDKDQVDPWREGLGSGEAINIACGLLFSASSALNNLFQSEEFRSIASEISAQFYQSFLRMSAGQHLDLITKRPGLKTWFEIAEMKSGTFFELACWSGARLATDDPLRLAAYSRFGSTLGVLLQIHDDLDDLNRMKNGELSASLEGITRSLPFVYALEVCPEESRKRLLELLREAPENQDAFQEVVNLLDLSGVALYLRIEIERNLLLARTALETANPSPSAREAIYAFLHELEVKENS